jgi:hypothetical protein
MMLTYAARPLRAAAVGAALLFAALQPALDGRFADSLPATLTDHELWTLTQQLSEPNGSFVSRSGSSDNLLSNEVTVSTVAAALASRVQPGGIYLGVGPEQNFTYIAAIHPRIAFIADIRRGNLDLHLVYKAVFEMSANRADFVGRLFSRRSAAGLSSDSSAAELMNAYLRADPVTESMFTANLKAVVDHLRRVHGLPLGADDLGGIEYVYRNFYRYGPAITYTSTSNGRSRPMTSYATIMAAVDSATGKERGYLANEGNFRFVKVMEQKNLIVPIVGDFAGPKALRALGGYLREHGATVGSFYVSNVEQYLQRNGVWQTFCANVASLPLDAASVFVRPGSWSPLGSMTAETAGCRAATPSAGNRRGR